MTGRLRLHLSPDLFARLRTMAAEQGITLDELVARLLAEELPRLIAEDTAHRLRTALAIAYPIDVSGDVPIIPEGRPDTQSTE